ncbi:MAG TPA: tetratricopeptide repeat protein, partial [Haliangium sp.]|nr:tetratricopeptide repeat protein [Haliangium sp.]
MSGKQRKTGSDRLQERALALIERGLTSYRKGEVEAAVIDWRHALALDPHADRAREYIEHALAHKDLDAASDGPIDASDVDASNVDASDDARAPTQPDTGRHEQPPDRLDDGPDDGPDARPDDGRHGARARSTPDLDRSLGLAPTMP